MNLGTKFILKPKASIENNSFLNIHQNSAFKLCAKNPIIDSDIFEK